MNLLLKFLQRRFFRGSPLGILSDRLDRPRARAAKSPRRRPELAIAMLEGRVVPAGNLGPATFYTNYNTYPGTYPVSSQPVDSFVTLQGAYTDSDSSDHPTINIDWADGTQTNGVPVATGSGT